MAVMTPIAIGNVSAAIPVHTQGYPYRSPEYYAGDDQDYPSYDYYPYLAYAVPTRVGLGFGFFRHHDGHRGGFHSGVFHGGGRGGHR